MYKSLLILLVLTAQTQAATDICEVLNIKNCPGVSKQARRSSAQSLPTVGTAVQFNPANVSHDRGLGVETVYQPSQSPSFSFVTGTGKTGAAIVSSKIENAFFANRVIELDPNYLDRRKNKNQYKSDKYSLALGAALFKNKSFSLDLGLLLKYNTDIKRVNPGAGVSARIGILTLGASVYQDDVKLKFKDLYNPLTGNLYSQDYGSDSYQEKFTVQNFFAGIRIKNLFLDAGVIKTYYEFYDDNSNINLYSASYIWNKFLFNLALRREESPAPKYKDGVLSSERESSDIYGGIQYSFNQNLIIGAHYNYYLLDELSLSATLFF